MRLKHNSGDKTTRASDFTRGSQIVAPTLRLNDLPTLAPRVRDAAFARACEFQTSCSTPLVKRMKRILTVPCVVVVSVVFFLFVVFRFVVVGVCGKQFLCALCRQLFSPAENQQAKRTEGTKIMVVPSDILSQDAPWNVCVCVCVCVCVGMCVCACVYACVCVVCASSAGQEQEPGVFECVVRTVCMYVYVCVYVCVCVCMHVCVYEHVCMSVCVCVCDSYHASHPSRCRGILCRRRVCGRGACAWTPSA